MGKSISLIGIYAVTFVLSVATGATIPVIPIYASHLGGSYTDVGKLGTVYALFYTSLALPIGRFLVRFPRKNRWLIIFSGLLCFFSGLFYISSFEVSHLYVPKALEGVAWVLFFISSETLVTTLAHPSTTGKSMGLSTASYGIGSIFGSIVGGSLAEVISLKSVFYFYSTFSLLSIALSLLMIREGEGRSFSLSKDPPRGSSKKRFMIASLISACIIAVTYSTILSVLTNIFPLYAERSGVEVAWIGGLLATFWFGRVFSFIISGRLSDTMGRVNILIPALIGVAVASFLLTQPASLPILVLSFILYGVGLGATFPVTIAMLSDATTSRMRSVSMALFELFCGIGILAGSAAGGLLSDLYSPTAPYLMCLTLGIFDIIVLTAVLKMGAHKNIQKC